MNNDSIFSYIESSNTDKIIAYIQNPNNFKEVTSLEKAPQEQKRPAARLAAGVGAARRGTAEEAAVSQTSAVRRGNAGPE